MSAGRARCAGCGASGVWLYGLTVPLCEGCAVANAPDELTRRRIEASARAAFAALAESDDARGGRDKASFGQSHSPRRGERVRQLIVETIVQREADGLPAPTLRELATACGTRSLSVIAHHITVLEERGTIRRLPGAARAIRLASPNPGS